MDLMTLAAKLTLDDSGFRSGISNAESAGQNLAGKLSSMTVAVGNIMSDVIKKGFNTVKDMVGGAVNAYADYQQLIGGVETLFKKDADKVAAVAEIPIENKAELFKRKAYNVVVIALDPFNENSAKVLYAVSARLIKRLERIYVGGNFIFAYLSHLHACHRVRAYNFLSVCNTEARIDLVT